MLLALYKYYANIVNDASTNVFMTIGGFTKFLKDAALVNIDNNEKHVNYKLEFPFNLTLTAKTKFSSTMQIRNELNYNKFNTFNNYKKVIKFF